MKKLLPLLVVSILVLSGLGASDLLNDKTEPIVENVESIRNIHIIPIPTADPPAATKGDVVFVFDATGSMRWIISNMQSKAIDIMNEIKTSVPDTRFGVGSFTDYPGFFSSYGYSSTYGGSTDYAWCKNHELTTNVNDVANAINNIDYDWGGDGPQDYTRAVKETLGYNWRADALKIVVLFGDAPPHSAPSGQTLKCPWNPSENLFSSAYGGDPGPDEIMFTADDIDYGPVVSDVADEGLIFICVDCQSSTGGGYAQDAHNNFEYLAYKTGGSRFSYDSAEIAQDIISRVLEEETSFYFIHLTDTHYGYNGARNRVKTHLIDDIIDLQPKPAFVIVSGDLLSWGFSSPGLPIAAWPFYEEESNDYLLFKSDFQKLVNNGIPYFVCPGNHDFYMWPYGCIGLGKYHNQINSNDRYSFIHGDTCVISINSGCDDLLACPVFPPKGSGLSSSDLTWMENVLDGLDGDTTNDCDTSGLNKVIFMHHPTINYMYKADGCLCIGVCWKVIPVPPFIIAYPCPKPCSRWDAGCIHNNRPQFKQLSDQYDVDVVVSGHIHWNRVYDQSMDWSSNSDDRDGYDYSDFPLPNGDETLYVNTGAAYHGNYRMIKCESDGVIVWYQNKVIDEVVGTISGCPVNLHLYDSAGNHVGINETGEIEFEIENATYSIFPIDPTNLSNISDPTTWEHKEEEISLIYGSSTFTFEIEGTGEGNFSFILTKELKDNSQVNLYYENISVTENFTGVIEVYEDSIDYLLYIDENNDGIIDYEFQPDNIITTNAPYKPAKPSGPIIIEPDEYYTYTTSTTDPEGDQVYYLFDWGDGTDSGWIGPCYSGESIDASHKWNEPGTYDIRIMARDGWNHMSDWSDALLVSMDNTPPEIILTDDQIILWPPNHEYHTVEISDFVISVTDNYDPDVNIDDIVITSVSSDEPENGIGDGNTWDDIVIVDSQIVKLRAERRGGGNGRVYTINFEVSDAFGNTATECFKIMVPHDQGSTAIDDGADAGYTVYYP